MYPHRIRLRGPWEAFGFDADGRPTIARVDLPTGQIPPDWRGPVRLCRKFGLPRTIDPWERVWLDVVGHGGAEVTLNGIPQEQMERGPRHVTQILEKRNEIAIDFANPPAAAIEQLMVSLEVRGETYLNVLVVEQQSDGSRLLRGRVIGEPKSSLELYVLINGQTVDYQRVQSHLKGCPFEVRLLPEESAEVIRVELIEGANVWWTQELSGVPPRPNHLA